MRKTAIIQAARDFLLKHTDGYAETGGRTNYSDAGVTAIWLLRAEIHENSELKQAIKENWIGSITGISFDDREYAKTLHALAYKLDPQSVRKLSLIHI